MRIVFIRHGLTAGNLEKRYIGRTDETLCREGETALRQLTTEPCDVLVCSPMKRCVQTAEILFPGQHQVIADGLRECDFGRFEGKNYKELTGDREYQAWIDSGGTAPFPGGESPEAFRKRCTDVFTETVGRYSDAGSIAFVVHGGTVMAVMERFALPHSDYYSWHCENGHGYICLWDGTSLSVKEKI